VCPTGATWKEEETGIVMVDPETCIGCKSCIEACPYDVRIFNAGEPAYALDFAVGQPDAPVHLANTVEKCTLCKNLVDQGKNPTCVDACVGYARFFGDLDDPESEVAKMIASTDREVIQLLQEQGTEPSVYYMR
jgi:molybdopterin-containing oxidoreductase family iron-sulfur binding subunit